MGIKAATSDGCDKANCKSKNREKQVYHGAIPTTDPQSPTHAYLVYALWAIVHVTKQNEWTRLS